MKVRKLNFLYLIGLNIFKYKTLFFKPFLFGKTDIFINFNYSGNQNKKIKLC